MPGCRKNVAFNGAGWAVAFCILWVIMGCSGTEVGNPDSISRSSAGEVETLASDAELESYLKNQIAESVDVYPSFANDIAAGGGIAPVGSPGSAPEPASDAYSQTNVQEAGVEESDMVKTDGVNFYVASGRSFHVVDISGAMQTLATRTVDGYVEALYLYDGKLVVLYALPQDSGDPWGDIAMPPSTMLFGFPDWIPAGMRQGVAIYDILDPGNPVLMKSVEFDGHFVSSRLIGGKLHIVAQFKPQLPPLDHWYDGTPEDLENKTLSNRQAIADMTLAQLVPSCRVVSDPPDSRVELPAVSSQNFYRPVTQDGGGTITTIISFHLDDPTLPFDSIGLVADAHIVYASTRALYIASHKYFYDAQTAEETTLYKFDLTGDVVRCVGGGAISGWILNQFSLGEYQDVLRVATTTGHAGGWETNSRNHVYCLQLEGEKLQVIGKIEDLAPGEQIYAARFMGARGYLVTYVKIDPLFVLNLSDPFAPRVEGYLKVPGYSSYIHPYGDNYLITVGKDALLVEEDNMAWYQGVQLTIFDVSDFSNPILLHKEMIGDRGTSSEALYNHKAFTFWAANDLLALPIDLYEHLSPPAFPYEYGTKTFQGLYVYQVSSASGFSLLGRISTERTGGTTFSSSPWTRGIFVDQQVYAVTDDAVRSAQIGDIGGSVQTLILDQVNNGN